ncbi:DUF928 domain-containing protein [Geitlerinema sp. CS-897]|nr:DUF928 domain-containing protein [Geitlerinema sp. CS-897]
MTWFDGLRPRITLAIASILELAIVVSSGTPVRSQPTSDSSDPTGRPIPIVNFEPPPGSGQPSGNRSGGNRDCFAGTADSNGNSFLTLLVPETLQGLTVNARPALFAYLPPTQARSVRLKLEDEDGNLYFYDDDLPVADAPGIYQFAFPDEAPDLEVGRRYQWTIAVTCREEARYDDPAVAGWVERIEADSSLALPETEASIALAATYAAEGLWFDTLAILAELQQARPNDPNVRREWEHLLESIGLAELATEPLRTRSTP